MMQHAFASGRVSLSLAAFCLSYWGVDCKPTMSICLKTGTKVKPIEASLCCSGIIDWQRHTCVSKGLCAAEVIGVRQVVADFEACENDQTCCGGFNNCVDGKCVPHTPSAEALNGGDIQHSDSGVAASTPHNSIDKNMVGVVAGYGYGFPTCHGAGRRLNKWSDWSVCCSGVVHRKSLKCAAPGICSLDTVGHSHVIENGDSCNRNSTSRICCAGKGACIDGICLSREKIIRQLNDSVGEFDESGKSSRSGSLLDNPRILLPTAVALSVAIFGLVALWHFGIYKNKFNTVFRRHVRRDRARKQAAAAAERGYKSAVTSEERRQASTFQMKWVGDDTSTVPSGYSWKHAQVFDERYATATTSVAPSSEVLYNKRTINEPPKYEVTARVKRDKHAVSPIYDVPTDLQD